MMTSPRPSAELAASRDKVRMELDAEVDLAEACRWFGKVSVRRSTAR
jgi:hypothetical protein